jgi:hypothetical protein
VPAMKLTPNAAMRARDVSRPRADQLAEAEAAEATVVGSGRPSPRGPRPGGAERGRQPGGVPEAAREGQPEREIPRRRRGPRDPDRRGRPTR